MSFDETDFLWHNNAIESVTDAQSFNDASQAWDYLKRVSHLTVRDMCAVHYMLMRGDEAWSEPHIKLKYVGTFRDCPVWVGGKEAPHWATVPGEIEQWLWRMNGTRGWPVNHLDDVSKELHVKYENIHPFIDGNGRTGRMFMNWFRLKVGLPILVIHEGPEQQEYYKWFK